MTSRTNATLRVLADAALRAQKSGHTDEDAAKIAAMRRVALAIQDAMFAERTSLTGTELIRTAALCVGMAIKTNLVQKDLAPIAIAEVCEVILKAVIEP